MHKHRRVAAFGAIGIIAPSLYLLLVPSAKAQTLVVGVESNNIRQVASGGGANSVTTLISGAPLAQTEGVTFDASGNLYVADFSNNAIYKVTSGGLLSTYATGLSNPEGIVLDNSGNLYVSNFGNNTVSKVTTGGGVSTFATGLNAPVGIALSSAGNLYVANLGDSTIDFIATSGIAAGSAQVFANQSNGLFGARGLAFDPSGNLYTGNTTNGSTSILKFTLGAGGVGGTVNTYVSSFANPVYGLVFDGSGNLFASGAQTGIIYKIAQGGGAGAVSTYADSTVASGNSANGGLGGASFLAIQPAAIVATAAPDASTLALLSFGLVGSAAGSLLRRRQRGSAG